jgi:hypothetical protein
MLSRRDRDDDSNPFLSQAAVNMAKRSRMRVGDRLAVSGLNVANNPLMQNLVNAGSMFFNAALGYNPVNDPLEGQQVPVKGRGTDPAAPQGSIRLTVNYRYNEDIRVQAKEYTFPENWNASLVTDAAPSKELYQTGRGLPVFIPIESNGLAQYNVGGINVCNGQIAVNNLDMQRQYKIIGFSQNPSNAGSTGNENLDTYGNVDSVGLMTTILTGSQPARIGDKLIMTVQSYSVVDGLTGNRVPKWVVKGLSANLLLPQLLPIRTLNIASMFAFMDHEAEGVFAPLWGMSPKEGNSQIEGMNKKLVQIVEQSSWSNLPPLEHYVYISTFSYLYNKLLMWTIWCMYNNVSYVGDVQKLLYFIYDEAFKYLQKYYIHVITMGSGYGVNIDSAFMKAQFERAPISLSAKYSGKVDLQLDNKNGKAKTFADIGQGWTKAIKSMELLQAAKMQCRNQAQETVDNGYAGEALTNAAAGQDVDILIRITG